MRGLGRLCHVGLGCGARREQRRTKGPHLRKGGHPPLAAGATGHLGPPVPPPRLPAAVRRLRNSDEPEQSGSYAAIGALRGCPYVQDAAAWRPHPSLMTRARCAAGGFGANDCDAVKERMKEGRGRAKWRSEAHALKQPEVAVAPNYCTVVVAWATRLVTGSIWRSSSTRLRSFWNSASWRP
jgi:hypothetical protein